jgi:hypothetical protein
MLISSMSLSGMGPSLAVDGLTDCSVITILLHEEY